MAGIIDRGAAPVRFLVERAALRYIVRHIRDVYAEQVMPVFERLERYRIVEVLGVVPVDGEDQLVPQVEPLSGGGQVDRLRDGVRLP